MGNYIYVPFAPPKNVTAPCEICEGTGITGELFGMEVDNGRTLLIDVFCPGCHGCGSGNHRSCEPTAHADYDPGIDGPWSPAYDDDPDLAPRPGVPVLP
jgi:hypothetical protein